MEPIDIEKIKEEQDSINRRKMLLGAFGSIGDALSNRSSSADVYLGRNPQKNNAVSNVAQTVAANINDPMKEREQAMKINDYNMGLQERDPESETSRRFIDSLSAYSPGVSKALQGKSAFEAKQLLPILTENEKFKRQQDWDMKKLSYERQTDLMKKAADRDLKKPANMTPEQRLSKLSGEDKKRYDNVVMGQKAVNDMAGALAKGDNTFSLIGDNDFTFAARRWDEAIGRMQSGGAINEEEAKRFRAMMPGATDSREMQAKKLTEMTREMNARLGTLGFKPQEVTGFSDENFESNIEKYSGSPMSQSRKEIVKTQTNKRTGERRVVYADGTTEVISKRTAGR